MKITKQKKKVNKQDLDHTEKLLLYIRGRRWWRSRMGSLPASPQIHQKLIEVTEQLLQSNLWTTAEDSRPPGGQTRLPGMRERHERMET